jgi:membrane protein
MIKSVKTIFKYLSDVINEYVSNNVIKYSASLAYYTTLSIAPLLIIVIHAAGVFFGEDALRGELFHTLDELVGQQAAIQLQSMIQNIYLSDSKSFATTVSIIVLLFGATGIFAEIQDSLNKIWGLKTIETRRWWKLIIDRLVSFSMIVSLGFVLMVSLVVSAFVFKITGKINHWLGTSGEIMLSITDHLMSLISTTLIFAAIFKVLPDAKIKWKDVFIGALITAGLFLIGKMLIGIYLSNSNLADIFGAAGSVIIIMLWVYYSSAILYLGAVFTKVYATNHGGKIKPSGYAVWIVTEEKIAGDVSLHDASNDHLNK